MSFHGVLNMYKTKYGVEPIEEISRDNLEHGFEIMFIVYETFASMICF